MVAEALSECGFIPDPCPLLFTLLRRTLQIAVQVHRESRPGSRRFAVEPPFEDGLRCGLVRGQPGGFRYWYCVLLQAAMFPPDAGNDVGLLGEQPASLTRHARVVRSAAGVDVDQEDGREREGARRRLGLLAATQELDPERESPVSFYLYFSFSSVARLHEDEIVPPRPPLLDVFTLYTGHDNIIGW